VILKNCVYNHNFQHPPNSIGRWPPGWEPVGGNADTSWRRVAEQSSDGRYCLVISNPTHEGRCGVREVPPVTIAVNPGDRWRVEARIRLAVAGKVYMAIDFYSESGNVVAQVREEFDVSQHMEVYGYEYSVPPLAVQGLLEIGIEESNTLWIDWVAKVRKETDSEQLGEKQDVCNAIHAGGQGLFDSGKDQCFVVLVERPITGNPRIELGRCLTSLGGRKKERITFYPGDQSVEFGEVFLRSTGRVILEFSIGEDNVCIRLEFPASEIRFALDSPLRLTRKGAPLNIEVVNPSREPFCYCLLVVGEVKAAGSRNRLD